MHEDSEHELVTSSPESPEKVNTQSEFEGWAILELMGHRRLAGYVRAATIAGAGVIRIDIPKPLDQPQDEPIQSTQFYSPAALYALTPITEIMARNLAKMYQPEPVSRWELPESIEVGGDRYD